LAVGGPLIVHEEDAAVGDEGRIRVPLLLVLFVLPPLALRERLWSAKWRIDGRGRCYRQVPRLKIHDVIASALV
jgi:hypothetical protein